MLADKDIIRPALSYLVGKSKQLCRLCFCSIDDKYISLDEDIVLNKGFFEETVSYSDILSHLSIPPATCLPHSLCIDCAKMAVTSYTFQKLCQYSHEKWNFAVDQLYLRLNQIEELDASIAYVMINEGNNLIIKDSKPDINNIMKKNSKAKQTKKNKSDRNNIKIPFICDECGKSFKAKYNLTKHMTTTHSKDVFTCPKCHKMFATKFKLDYHTDRMHTPKTIQCPNCPKKFSTLHFFNKHDKEFHQAAICKICFIQLPSRHLLQKHLGTHGIYQCPLCSKNFANKDSFRLHSKICGVGRQPNFFCDICGKSYARKNGLRTHLKVDHGFGNVLSCQWCDKKYDSASQMKTHQLKHTKEKNFYCEHCGGKFVTPAALVYHVRLHTGEKPYACDLCDESFLSASRRMDHKRRKHFAPSKECEICHAKFVTKFQLKKHVQCHFNPKSKLFVPSTQNDEVAKLFDGMSG